MRLLIVSDSHGKSELLRRLVDRVHADHTIHCGDFTTVQDALPNPSLTVVRGNCDWVHMPEEAIYEQGGLRILVVHGHQHHVHTSLLAIQYRAQEVKADILCFGHTHFPLCAQEDSLLLVNPGSIAFPRGSAVPTYAVLESTQAKKVSVLFFAESGQRVEKWGGNYSFSP